MSDATFRIIWVKLSGSRGEYRCVYQRRANGRVSASALWVEAEDELDAYKKVRAHLLRDHREAEGEL